MRFIVLLLCAISTTHSWGQGVSGRVYDKINQEPLIGATISLNDLGVITNEVGAFSVDSIQPGRYQLEVRYVGYKTKVISDLWVKSGKESFLAIYLDQDFSNLDEVMVTDQSYSSPGRITISEEQINRFAASYYDPARLITSSPDVAVANDQNNEISVRGIAPIYNTWTLEGVEIVNPNHLSNAGTFLDRPTATGGGVNILSAQMLDNSSFNYSTYDNTMGNSVGGIFDMGLRSGNSEEYQFTAQASLIGLDIFSEGPISKSMGITYAANYRYSFTGLLTNMGVDFGGESIGFQDFSIAIQAPIGRSTLKVFGVGGLSFNYFDHKDFDESEVDKDRRDIYYDNKMGVVGATINTPFKKSKLSNTFAISGYNNVRDQTNFDDLDNGFFNQEYEDGYRIYSGKSTYLRRFKFGNLEVGSSINYYDYSHRLFSYSNNNVPTGPTTLKRQLYGRHFLQMDHQLSNTVFFNYGVTYNWNNNDKHEWDPRAKFRFLVSPTSEFSLGYGKYSQLYQPFNVYFSAYENQQPTLINTEDFITSHRYTFGYDLSLNDFHLGVEFFHYNYPEVYIPQIMETSATSTGFSAAIERSFVGGYYLKAGGSIFDAPLDTEDIRNRFNTRFNWSAAGGKEWKISTAKKNSSFGINGRLMYQGGQYYISSNNWWWWRIDQSRTDRYFRFDLRVQWVRYREKYTRIIAIDLQNALNTKNEAYTYIDGFKGEEVTQYQLGIIPILTYRVEW